MIVTDLIRQANNLADDEFDNIDWIGWMNDAISDLSPYLEVEDVVQIQTIAGKADYALPSETKEVLLVKHNSKPLEKTNMALATSVPDGYYLFGSKLYLTTTPINTDETVTVYVKRSPHFVATGFDTPEIPDRFQRLLVLYGVYMSQLKDDEGERATQFYTEYMTGKAEVEKWHKRKLGESATTPMLSWGLIR